MPVKALAITLAAALCMLCGCSSADFAKYPAASDSAAEAQTLTLLLRDDCDPLLADAMAKLADKAAELSSGTVLVEIKTTADPLAGYLSGGDSALLTLTDVISLDADCSFAEYPFFFITRELFQTYMNSPAGWSSGLLSTVLEGEVAAVFSAGSAGILSKTELAMQEDFSGADIALIAWPGGSDLFRLMGAKSITPSAAGQPQELLESGEVQQAEVYAAELTGTYGASYYYATRHRFVICWLTLRTSGADAPSAYAADIFREAVAEITPALDEAVVLRDSDALDKLALSGVTVVAGDYTELYYAASDVYRDRFLDLGLGKDLYDRIYVVLS